MTCPNCRSHFLVCEWHPDKLWPAECDCGAGMPCPVCSPASLRITTEDAERAKAVQRAVEAAMDFTPYGRR